MRLLRDELRELYRGLLSELQARAVLDVGTGFGENLRSIVEAARGGELVVTLDVSLEALRGARLSAAAKGPELEFVNADAQSLPLRDSSVELVSSSATLHHLSSVEAFFAEARRVLKPGGALVVVEWTPGSRLSPHSPEQLRRTLESVKKFLPLYFKLEDLRVYRDYLVVAGSKPRP